MRIIRFVLTICFLMGGIILQAQSFFGASNIIDLDTINSNASDVAIYNSDLDNDGDQDVLVATKATNQLMYYLNDGRGNFTDAISIDNNFRRAIDIISADLDGDGDQDVIAASQQDNKVSCYFNDGNGHFGSENIITTNLNGISSIFAADLNGDTFMDILSASVFDNKLAWYQNDGIGNFGTQKVISTSTDGTNYVTTSDIDDDGDQDVFCTSQSDDKASWFKNDGIGNFGSQQLISNTNSWPTKIHIAKIDADDHYDVVISNFNSDLVTYHSSDGAGNFGSAQTISEGAGASSFDIGDVDNDGDKDILLGLFFGDFFGYALNNGSGEFGAVVAISNASESITDVLTADLNGDGLLDAVSGSASDFSVIWYENLLGGPFISGNIFYDENANGIRDEEEGGIASIPVLIQPEAYAAFTNGNGSFEFLLEAGSYIVSPEADSNWVLTTDYSTATVSVTDSTFVDSLLFGFTPTHWFHDGTLNVGSGLPRCDTEVPFQIVFTNTGSSILDGAIGIANFDNIELVDNSANPTMDSLVNDTMYWGFEDLNPGESVIISIKFLINGPDFIGDSLCLNTLSILIPQEGEVSYPRAEGSREPTIPICHCTSSSTNPYVFLEVPQSAADGQGNNDHTHHFCDIIPITDLNNDGVIDVHDCNFDPTEVDPPLIITSSYKKEIRCSFDPNDKLANPEGEGEDHLTLLGQDFIYTIRFQNTGNDTAFYVSIIDTLDQNLDASTFTFINASHDVEVFSQIINTGTSNETSVLQFEFENIILPDSAVDYAGSNGYISFSIRAKADVEENTVINNTAHIFFDQNAAVVTNETYHTLVQSLSIPTRIDEEEILRKVNIYPNPFSNTATFQIKGKAEESYAVEMTNLTGQKIRNYLIQSDELLQIKKQNLPSGIYFLNVYEKGKEEILGSYKLVKE